MTDEWKTKLKAHIKSETEDHEMYMKMAEDAKKDNMMHLSGILHDIAEEETSHAKLIMHMLEVEG